MTTLRGRTVNLARLALVASATSLFPVHAFAQQTNVGTRIQLGLTDLIGPLLFVITLSCTLGGVFLFAKGLLKLREASQDRNGLGGSMMTIFAATMLIALPEVAGIGMGSVMGSSGLIGSRDISMANQALDGDAGISKGSGISTTVSRMATVTAPRNCIQERDAIPCMAENLAKNIVPIGVIAVFGFVFLAGLWGFGSALFELARSHGQEGRGTPPGWWGKALASILMMNGPPFFIAVTNSILGTDGNAVTTSGLNAGSSVLSYSISNVSVLQQYATLIGHVFTIMVLFGVLAFVKGLFVIKSAAERQGNATFSHGIVFMVAGVLLANSKLSTCAILSSITGDEGSRMLGFCT